MTADVASLTACVVVDCCSKTRDSNTPHIRPRRVDPAWPAQRVVRVRTSGVFPPFQGRPASTVATGPGLISHRGATGGHCLGVRGPGGLRGLTPASNPSYNRVTRPQALGQQSTDQGVELYERNYCEPELSELR